ncbi:MAG TPA: DUF4124 domain-containing protein [Porticoccaceae bacterium]|nr:DUF4124 domain-containing protein [Porticoccaceae bacterium]
MKIPMIILFATALGLAFSSDVLAAKVYKWTDENGVTHYGAVAPQGNESETVDVRTGEHKPATDEVAKDDTKPPAPAQTTNKPQKEPEKSTEETKAAKKKEKAIRAQRKKNCEIARKNAEILRTRARVRINDPDTGELRYLTPEEKKTREEETAKSIEENCD